MKKLIWLSVILLTCTLAACSKSKKLARQQRSDLRATYKTLKKEMAEAKVTYEGEKVKVVLPEAILFRLNSAELNPDYLPILKKMAGILNKYQQTDILVTGYTDTTGGILYNNDLSERRAESARQVMVDNKVAPARIHTWGLGARNPIADNRTEEGRKQNRRVEYIIMYDYEQSK
jgi:outer membrane protein OmpA-like peptidoglycan-associated protein